MNKKFILTIILTVVVTFLISFVAAVGTVYVALDKINNPDEEEEVVEEIDPGKINYELLQTYTLKKMTIKLAQTASKPHYLILESGVYVADEEMLARMAPVNSKIEEAIFNVFADKTAAEIEGKENRPIMKQLMLDAIREIFLTQEDKDKIVDVVITNYMIAQQ